MGIHMIRETYGWKEARNQQLKYQIDTENLKSQHCPLARLVP